MLHVKNYIQGKALGVAEYLTPVLKVRYSLILWSNKKCHKINQFY